MNMKIPPEEQLGQVILQNTPYSKMELPDDFQDYIEWDGRPVVWNFRELPRRINKSIRIPVKITVVAEKIIDHTGKKDYIEQTYEDWLVVGYEGGAGM